MQWNKTNKIWQKSNTVFLHSSPCTILVNTYNKNAHAHKSRGGCVINLTPREEKLCYLSYEVCINLIWLDIIKYWIVLVGHPLLQRETYVVKSHHPALHLYQTSSYSSVVCNNNRSKVKVNAHCQGQTHNIFWTKCRFSKSGSIFIYYAWHCNFF